ncbi:MAG: hypothetical protein ACRCYY_05140 [Trueperaceae bacterium]
MKALYLLFGACFLTLAVAQSFDTPLQEVVQSPDVITTLLQDAKETLFMVTPVMSPTLEQELQAAAARGVAVYFITLPANPSVTSLQQAGVQVKTLETFSEGLLLVDKTLIAGGLLSGTQANTVKIDTSAFGTSVLEQLRAVWQIAKPLGG